MKFWDTVHDLYHTLKQARFSIIVVLIAIPVFCYVDQGVELVRAIGEGNQYDGTFYTAQQANLYALLAALLVWCFNSWYWARVTLDLHSPDGVPAVALKTEPLAWLIEHLPRILGVLPLLIFGVACLRVRATYGPNAPSHPKLLLLLDALACFLLSAVLYCFFIYRRKWLKERGVKSIWKDHGDHRVRGVRNLSRGTLTAAGAMLLFSSILFLLFLASPVTLPKVLGSAAILGFSAASWTCFGSALVAVTISRRIPIITILILVALGASLFNDNHAIRVLDRKVDARPNLRDALAAWATKLDQDFPDEKDHPVFIVTAAGGGIRAAYWTATVLGTLQEKSVEAQARARKSGGKVPPDFASHLFAISGVSGGSLGAAVFAAELVESRTSDKLTSGGQAMLGEDFLSPPLAALLNRDWLQRFLPWKIDSWDRATALEQAWEDGWRRKVDKGTDRFAQSLGDLYGGPPAPWVPYLFLNGTSVEAGRRVICSKVEINPPTGTQDFVDAADATDELRGAAMRLSTAAHLSARFTYVSPAGLFPDGQHVVDGGYFENSGDTTAWDILQALKSNNDSRISPIIIEISNAPGEPPISAANPASAVPPPQMPLHGFIGDVLAPIYAMLDTRDARGTYSQKLIREAGCPVKEFTLASSDVPLPLGWMLSGGAAQEMRDQIDMYSNPRANPHDTTLVTGIVGCLGQPKTAWALP